MKSANNRQTYQNSPTAWFVVLEAARQRGDFEKAAAAKKELERLGVRVRYRPAQTEQGVNHAAR